jgi:hypothetical protein
MDMNRHLVASAVLGILTGAACGAAHQGPSAPRGVATAGPSGAKEGCGNHPAGACSSPSANQASAGSSTPGAPLAIARKETVEPGKHFEVGLSLQRGQQGDRVLQGDGAGPVGRA